MHVNQLTEKFDSSVDKVTKARKKKQAVASGTSSSSKYSNKQEKLRRKSINNCKFCAGRHLRGKCPAYGQRCRTSNHFAKCCRQTIDKVKNKQDSYSDTTDGRDCYIGSVEVTHADQMLLVSNLLRNRLML